MTRMHPARRLWMAVEPIHAVTYFDPGCRAAADELGLKGFWMGYFAFRSAPLGPVGPEPVRSMFAGFRPAMVARALPDAWTFAAPDRCLTARAASAAGALRTAGVDDAPCSKAAAALERVTSDLDLTGRPLAAANAALTLADDPVERLWQLTTTLREHRGDGHVAAIVAAGMSGFEAHLLHVAAGDATWGARGWTDDERADAEDGLRARGLLDAGGALTADGAARRAAIESATDDAAWAGGVRALGADGVDALVTTLAPSTSAGTSLLSFPNPIGLPARG